MHSGLKVAVGGKGGVGKTTVCAGLAKLFAEDGFDVLAIDADPNTCLASVFGIPPGKEPQPLVEMKQLIAERTGTGRDAVGSYFKLNPQVNDLPEKYWVKVGSLKLLILGGITQPGGGCACPEGAFLRALLMHTVLERQEVVIVDLAAGVEFMGRASVQGIDALVVVVEPGGRSIETAINIARMAEQSGIKHIASVINKIMDTGRLKMIKSRLKDIPVLAEIGYIPAVQEADLQQTDVFKSSAQLVGALKKAKDNLMDLININVEPS